MKKLFALAALTLCATIQAVTTTWTGDIRGFSWTQVSGDISGKTFDIISIGTDSFSVALVGDIGTVVNTSAGIPYFSLLAGTDYKPALTTSTPNNDNVANDVRLYTSTGNPTISDEGVYSGGHFWSRNALNDNQSNVLALIFTKQGDNTFKITMNVNGTTVDITNNDTNTLFDYRRL